MQESRCNCKKEVYGSASHAPQQTHAEVHGGTNIHSDTKHHFKSMIMFSIIIHNTDLERVGNAIDEIFIYVSYDKFLFHMQPIYKYLCSF